MQSNLDEIVATADRVYTAHIVEDVRAALKTIYQTSHFLSLIDFLTSLATYARKTPGVCAAFGTPLCQFLRS